MAAKKEKIPMELDSPEADLRYVNQECDFFTSLGEEISHGAMPVGVYLLYEALYEKVLRDFKNPEDAWTHFKNVLTMMQWLKSEDLDGLGFFSVNPKESLYKKMIAHFKEQEQLSKEEAQKEKKRGKR